ncbi:hypothetical protein D3C84_823750 [compost metagenome]
MMPPPAMRPNARSAPSAVATAVLADGKSIAPATITFPKLEAGSVVVPASVLHHLPGTQDLANTRSSRGLGGGHCSLGGL